MVLKSSPILLLGGGACHTWEGEQITAAVAFFSREGGGGGGGVHCGVRQPQAGRGPAPPAVRQRCANAVPTLVHVHGRASGAALKRSGTFVRPCFPLLTPQFMGNGRLGKLVWKEQVSG